ncbi:hypothetical protein B0O80DRAFT_372989, partial [Mortierella sp. GBAus27b]
SCGGSGGDEKDLMVVAVNSNQMSKALCGKSMTVKYGQKTIVVKVVDTCKDCPSGLIDLSKEAFSKLADKGKGELKVEWSI